MVVMLDTEIQLDGVLPAKLLASFDKMLDTQRLMLLRNLPWDEAEPVWKSLYQPARPDSAQATRVAAQMLVQHPPAGFAAQLLQTIDVRARVIVVDPDSGLGFGQGFGSCCGAGVASLGDDWPYAGSYVLLDPPRDGSPPPSYEKLWLAGVDPVYVWRQVNRTYWASICGGLFGLNDAIRSHLVGTLLGGNPVSPFPEKTIELQIEFHDREAYRARVAALVDEQQDQFNRIASALTARGLLTEEERQAAALTMELSLSDFRKPPAVDLPVIAFRAPITWSAGP